MTGTQTVEKPPAETGDRVHVKVRYQAISGTMSTNVHLYGYVSADAEWYFLGSMNDGNSLTTANATMAAGGFNIRAAEVFSVSQSNYKRLHARCINPQGGSPLVSTWIGYEQE